MPKKESGLHRGYASFSDRRSAHITPKTIRRKLWFKALVSSRHVRRRKDNKVEARKSNVSFVGDKQIFDHGKYTRFSERQFIENSLELISRPDISSTPRFVVDSDRGSEFKLCLQNQNSLETVNYFQESDMEESSSAKIVHLRSRSNLHNCPLDMQRLESSDSDSDILPFDQIMHLSGTQLKEEVTGSRFESIQDALETILVRNDTSSSSNADESVKVIKLEGNKSQRSSWNEKMKNKVFTVKIPERNQIVLILQHPAEVVIKGISWLKVVSGSVTAYGYHMNSSKPSISIFSSRKFGYINVSTNAPELRTLRSSKKNIASELKAITGVYFTHMKNVLNHLSVVLLLQPAKILKARVEYALMHIGEENLPTVSRQQEISAYGLSISLVGATTKLACDVNGEWLHLTNIIQDAFAVANEEESSAPRIVVCGGKDSGKSTLLRYLMNTILNICSSCYHLEADIGQTEFSPPGCVSLTNVDKPVLGPPFTHMKTPEKMYFLGAPSIKVPDDYLYAFTAAFEHYSQQSHKTPLFINTMGWTKDIGMLILMDILHIAQPTHVIQINFEDSRRGQNFRTLTPQLVYETNGWRFTKSDKKLQQYRLIEVSSIFHTGEGPSKGSFTAVENRNLAILSYLGRLQAANSLEILPINAFYPYVLPWSAVAVYIYHHIVPQKQILFALNATWVALCKVPDPKVLEGDDEMPKMLTSIENNECLGFGIIRGIDVTKHLFYIITPEPLTRLYHVNALIKGSVNLPERLLTSQDGENLPYCNEGTASAFCQNK